MYYVCVSLVQPLLLRMPYTELLRLWNESVQAVDANDWEGALAKLQQIPEPTSRTHFNAASAHLALGQLDMALKVCVNIIHKYCLNFASLTLQHYIFGQNVNHRLYISKQQ